MDLLNVTADANTFTCNAYLLPTGRPALVDAGSVDGVVEAIGAHVDDLEALVLTHQHGDHVEQLGAVVDAFDPTVYAFGAHPRRDVALADGDAVDLGEETFEVVHTPGHAEDHVAFVSASTIFSGDVVVHDDGAFDDGSFGRTDIPGADRDVLVESLRTLLGRLPEGVEHMYAGHGGEFHGDVRTVIERALGRAERREPKYPDG